VLVCFRPFAPDGAGTPRVKLRKTPKKDESVLSFSPSGSVMLIRYWKARETRQDQLIINCSESVLLLRVKFIRSICIIYPQTGET
jgi:hypothetical protein